MKIVINDCYGGFALSDAAMYRYAEIKGITVYVEGSTFYTVPADQRVKDLAGNWVDHSEEEIQEYNKRCTEEVLYCRDMNRNDSTLIQVVEELGSAANGDFAALKVVEIPDDVQWEIEEYDGSEWIAEKHRTWS